MGKRNPLLKKKENCLYVLNIILHLYYFKIDGHKKLKDHE
jgi:hypothetical protein